MDRRELLISLASSPLGAVAQTVTESGANPSIGVLLAAPDDVFVASVAVVDGGVSAGQELMTLTSPTLERYVGRVATMKQLIAIAQRPFKDGRVEEIIANLRANEAASVEAEEAAAKQVEILRTQIEVGMAKPSELPAVIQEHASKKVELADAVTAAAHEPKRAKDRQDQLSAIQDQLEREAEFLDQLKLQLIIKSPFAGRFRAVAAAGAFVAKGDVCGVLIHG